MRPLLRLMPLRPLLLLLLLLPLLPFHHREAFLRETRRIP